MLPTVRSILKPASSAAYNPGANSATHQWAARLQTGLSNNDSMTQFTDTVGTLNPTATGAGIIWQTNQINGLPAISFAAGTDAFLGGAIGLSGNPDLSVFIVGSTVLGSIRRVLQFGSVAASNGSVKSYGLNAPSFRSSNWSRIFSGVTNPADWHVFTAFNASGATVAGHRFLADGVELAQSSGANLASTPSIGNEETIIGASRAAGDSLLGNYFIGSLAEIVVVPSVSTHIINYHGAALASIYGLSWTTFAG